MTRGLLTVIVLLAFRAVGAADWPTWRHDAARSAASPDEIAPNRVLLWSRELPPVRRAWPGEYEQRLDFDASYEPVVMDKLLFLGSPNDGSITAYHTETGEEKWRFYTEGPVRFAPACWEGKIYAGSDDGYLYCLDAQTGSAVWKFRGAPADRPDRRQLGNEHLISFWPVRGGPVVASVVVYFGAGIWPVFGVFVHALDAETGKPKWTNANLNYVDPVRIDHDQFAEVGMSPQGYFVVTTDRLLVPNSRAMPAGLDRATGELTYYMQGGRHGDSRVAAHGQYAFVGKEGVLNLGDLRELGSRWVGRGNNKPDGYRGPVLRAEDIAVFPRVFPHWGYNADWNLYECPVASYKLADGCDASSAFENDIAYGSAKGVFYAYNLAGAQVAQVQGTSFGQTLQFLKWRPEAVWQFKMPYAGQSSGTVIKAGERLYGYAGRKLLALETLEKQPRLVWEKELAGTPTSLIAADNKLFAATAEGGIDCFGPPGATPAAPKTYVGNSVPLESKTDAWSAKVQNMVKASGVKRGYCLVLGLTDGRLIEELLKQTELLILGVDADAKKIERLRWRFAAAGLLGSRVELFVGAPLAFGFPPYLASLIVGDDVVVVACAEVTEKDAQHPDYDAHGYFESRTLVCLDRKTGTELWRRTAKHRFHNLGLAMGGGLFFCTDSIPSIAVQAARRSAPPTQSDSTIQALDLRTGRVAWSEKITYAQDILRWAGEFVQFSAESGVLLVGRKPNPIGLGAVISGLDAKTGKILWEKKKIGQAPVILHGKSFISGDSVDHGGNATIHDILTGEKTGDFPFRVDGCNYIIGSRHLIMARNATVAYADIEGKRNYNLRNIRSGCSNNLPAADGLLNAPNYAVGCVCNYPIQTSFAMVHMPEVAAWSGTTPVTVSPAALSTPTPSARGE